MTFISEYNYWEQRYQEGTSRWDLGQVAPPFVSLLDSSTAPPAGHAAVLGCGRGYDAIFFAERGFEVVGFDFAPSAIADATALARSTGSSAKFLQQDIFDLAFSGAFNYVIEHTCFCAIEPDQRPAYVQVVRTLLQPEGELISLFWAHSRPGGPPFGVTLAAIKQYFETDFEILSLIPVADSVPERQGEEYLGRFRVKDRGHGQEKRF